jgi:deoxyxylulose-5-phosphate synthase
MAQQQVLLRDQLHERVWQATHMAQAPNTPSTAPRHTADMRAVVAVAAGSHDGPAAAAVQGPAAAVNSEEILSAVGAVDDIIRYMSFQAAWIKVMNKVMAAARATLRDECQARQKALAWVK